ncbi:hypothetical protein [Vulcanisaeta sp. JCM 14467]|uniref:hypothetical protein n=1 Tax=Vulcanisaeta sp. JCM 14467 TaxID=1295370 RepID=UPI0006D0D339|nr:hypothetical protein [Vulcanisaeta sp. JCM 14467]
MSEPRVAGILMVITGAFLLIPAVLLGIASIILVPIPNIGTTIIWALTLIVIALAIMNIGAGALLISRQGDPEIHTLGIVVAALNLVFTWWTIVGALLAVLELAFLI